MIKQLLPRAGVLVFLLLAAAPVGAGDKEAARAQLMLRRAQQQLQEAQQQSADLEHAKSDAESKLKDASGQLDAAQKGARTARAHGAALEGGLKAARAGSADLEAKLAAANKALADMTAKQKETAAALAQRQAERDHLQADLDKSKQGDAACEAKNAQLYEYGQAVLKRYQDKGVWEALKSREPVTGIGGVEVQTTVQEYRDKLAQQKLATPPAAAASAAR